jgi:hypothetical protein
MATEDVAALQARIAELEAEKSPKRRFDGRGVTAWVLLVVAALLFPISLAAFWGQRTLVDTERYVATVAPLSQDPTIRLAVGDTITAVLVKQLDAQTRVSALLTDTPRLQPLSAPIAIGVNNFIAVQVTNILDSDQFSGIWEGINRKAQQALVKALTADPTGAVTLQGDQLVLDTGDLIEIVKQRLVDRGLTFAANIPVPSAADRDVVLLTSPQLQTARTAYAIGQPIAAWLVYAVLLLFVIAVLVSRRRARMVIAVGASLILGALVLRLAMAFGQNQLDLTLSGTSFAVAQQAFFTILTVFLLGAIRAAFALGLVLAILGWFFSGMSSAQATRSLFARGVGGAGEQAGDTPLGRAGELVLKGRKFWWLTIAVVSALVLLAADPLTGSLILWTAVLAIVALVVIEFLAAAGAAHQRASLGSDLAETDTPESVSTDDVDITHA